MNKVVRKRIRMYRAMKGLSQENVAEELNMTTGNYGKIERGEISISVDHLAKISKALHVSIAELFGEKGTSSTGESPANYVSRSEFLALQKEVKALAKKVKN